MASRKYRLGDLLEKQSLRNKNMEGDEPLGVSIDKEFMPSVANTIGTDLSKYMLLKRDFFACNPMHVGRDRVLPIARYKKEEPGIVSPAYFTFTADSELIDLDYLELFFKQAVFDRECWFYTDSTVRGGLSWDAFCGIEINIPSRKEQETISFISKSIARRIDALNTANDYLAAIGMALFNKECPQTNAPNAMLSDIAEITMGQSPSGSSYNEDGVGEVFYQGRGEFGSFFPVRRLFTTEPKRMAREGDTLMSVRAPVGDLNIANENCCIGLGLAAIHSEGKQSFVHYLMRAQKGQLDMFNGDGTVFGSINGKALRELPVFLIDNEGITHLESRLEPVDMAIRRNENETQFLKQLRDTLLPKLMSGEIDVSGLEI